MEVNDLNAQSVGVSVTGFDATPEHITQVRSLIYAKKLVILKNQKLNERQFCDLSAFFGQPVPYLQSNYHHPDYPLIFVSSNIKKNEKPFGVARTGGYWHSDTAFMETPIPLTLLYPQVIPKNSRRTTLFIDLERAYKAMPEDWKRRLESMEFIHSGRWKYKVRQQDLGLDISEILQRINTKQPPTYHPAVIKHPVTKQKILYASRGFTVGVKGMDTDSANEFLDKILSFIEQPQFIAEFQWYLGDIILWDNRFFAHKAGRLAQFNDPIDGDIHLEEETMVYRIILKDGHALSA